jgi:hypothetical protein
MQLLLKLMKEGEKQVWNFMPWIILDSFFFAFEGMGAASCDTMYDIHCMAFHCTAAT